MMAQRSPENEGPLTWIGNFPVYVSTALAGVHGLTLILTAVAMAAGAEGFLQAFVFSSQAVTKDYSLWQTCTYAFVHRPSYWLLLVELYLLVAFGREIETYLGRQSFVKLYAGLLITPPLVLAAEGWAGWPSIYWGSSALHFGIFVAFALLYPTAEILFSIQARWVALALLAINSLQCLALADYTSLTALGVDCVTACVIVGYFQGRFDRPERSVVSARAIPFRRPTPSLPEIPEENPIISIDPILEKISRSGMGSLNARERQLLEEARAQLIAKDAVNS
ncbi:MAG: rhomboid family intramembrane serine protease [bacterium]